ncbi:MarR family transcriptional regulator [Williamsia deligens]|nr:DNA-binding transcriptional regulator, MarR family [Williamsia deligens]
MPDDVWLSSAQKRDWASLVALLMALPTRLDAHLKQVAGINFYEYSVLVSLAEAPERTRVMSDLAVQARGSLSRLSHAVTRLETAGWVRRRSCGGAGRRTEVVLVEAGWQELQRIAPHHVDEVRRLVVDAIEPREFEQLGSAARHILACVDPLAATTLESAIGRLPRT